MALHTYRSRQVHETLNGVNPSSSFRDMRSSKSGPNLWQIWQVFGPWANPYGANGKMTMTVHNYRPRQFHRTSNGENPSSGYRDMGSASLAAAHLAARLPTRRQDRDDNTPPAQRAEGHKNQTMQYSFMLYTKTQADISNFQVPLPCSVIVRSSRKPHRTGPPVWYM